MCLLQFGMFSWMSSAIAANTLETYTYLLCILANLLKLAPGALSATLVKLGGAFHWH